MKHILTDIMGTVVHSDFLNTMRTYIEANGHAFTRAAHDEGIALLQRIQNEQRLGNFEDTVNLVVRKVYDQRAMNPEFMELLGMITNAGYESGALQAPFFDDVAPALQQWKANGKGIYVFSNGSETEQRNMFRASDAGDLSAYVDRYFSPTVIGNKKEPGSYARIGDALRQDPSTILFLSDDEKELAAADQAGMDVILIVRPGNKPITTSAYVKRNSFEDIGI